jgi:hypothetical protein
VFFTCRGTLKPKFAAGLNMVLQLATDNIFIDIKITSWTSENQEIDINGLQTGI